MPISNPQVWDVLVHHAPRNQVIELQDLYELVARHSPLDEEDLAPVTPTNSTPTWHRNVRRVLQYRKDTPDLIWLGQAQYIFPEALDEPSLEANRRRKMWGDLLDRGGPSGVSPTLLNELRFYDGQAGIYRDVETTKRISGDNAGIAVSLTHRGDSYPDDISDNHVRYHYPETGRVGSTDENEIIATKNTVLFPLPLFVITTNQADSKLRDVQMAWVVGWNDTDKVFDVRFGSQAPSRLNISAHHPEDEVAFNLDSEDIEYIERTAQARKRDQIKFRREVLGRYGSQCVLCDVSSPALLDAAHIKPHGQGGTDDPRNGLMLCPTHHRALDRGLLYFSPRTGLVVLHPEISSINELGVIKSSLAHLLNPPHPTALEWLWEQREFNVS